MATPYTDAAPEVRDEAHGVENGDQRSMGRGRTAGGAPRGHLGTAYCGTALPNDFGLYTLLGNEMRRPATGCAGQRGERERRSEPVHGLALIRIRRRGLALDALALNALALDGLVLDGREFRIGGV